MPVVGSPCLKVFLEGCSILGLTDHKCQGSALNQQPAVCVYGYLNSLSLSGVILKHTSQPFSEIPCGIQLLCVNTDTSWAASLPVSLCFHAGVSCTFPTKDVILNLCLNVYFLDNAHKCSSAE